MNASDVKIKHFPFFLVTRDRHLLTSYLHIVIFLLRIQSLRVLYNRRSEKSFRNAIDGVDLTEN